MELKVKVQNKKQFEFLFNAIQGRIMDIKELNSKPLSQEYNYLQDCLDSITEQWQER